MLFMNNPLTTVCSLVCNHENQCEGHCVLGRKGAPVHFSTIENYISTTYAPKMRKGPAPSNGMRVAISRLRPCGHHHRNYPGPVRLPGHDLRGQGQNRRRAPLRHTRSSGCPRACWTTLSTGTWSSRGSRCGPMCTSAAPSASTTCSGTATRPFSWAPECGSPMPSTSRERPWGTCISASIT